MKKLISIIIVLTLSILIVSAAELNGYTQEDANKAGLLPDSPFYGLKIAFQKITEMFGENIKLKHAEQRLSEIKVMVGLRMENQTQKSIDDFNRIYRETKNKASLEYQKKTMDNLGQKIRAIASVSKGNMTMEQKEQIRTEIKQLITTHKEAQQLKGRER